MDSMIAGGSIVAGAEVHRSVLFSNVRVEPGSHIEQSLLLPRATVGKNCVIRKAILDEGCRIPDGMQIGVDAESDARLYFVSGGGVVVVTPEMLGQPHLVR